MARNVAEVASAVQGVANVVQGWLSYSSRGATASEEASATASSASTQGSMATVASAEAPRQSAPRPDSSTPANGSSAASGDAADDDLGGSLDNAEGEDQPSSGFEDRGDARSEARGEAGSGRGDMGWAVNSGGRVDYQLQESELEIAHEYLAALRAHNTYFSNPDVAAFLIHEVVDCMNTG